LPTGWGTMLKTKVTHKIAEAYRARTFFVNPLAKSRYIDTCIHTSRLERINRRRIRQYLF
jgi:hypothetical protein